jgi:F420-dependent oxidoreductase-like protein
MAPHFGLHLNSFVYPGVPAEERFERAASIAVAAEQAGFDSLWVLDHVVQGGHAGLAHEPMLEAYTLLGALAARTTRATLGTLVTAVTFRNPAVLAKTVTTLDVVSGGRAVLGIGAAWYEPEHDQYGLDFPRVGERMDRLEDTLAICKAMFTQERATYEGKHHHVRDAINAPRPIQPGGPKILVGGTGEKRTLRLVAEYADICNFPKHTKPDVIEHKFAVLDRYCREIGRDPSTILRTRKRTLVIGPNRRSVWRKGAALREAWKEPRARYKGMVTEGTPRQIVSQVGHDLDTGFGGVIFNITDDYDVDMVRLAGETLRAEFG